MPESNGINEGPRYLNGIFATAPPPGTIRSITLAACHISPSSSPGRFFLRPGFQWTPRRSSPASQQSSRVLSSSIASKRNAFTSLDIALKSECEHKPKPESKSDQGATFFAACRKSDTATNNESSSGVSGGTDGAPKIQPQEAISTSQGAIPDSSARTAAASGKQGRGNHVHFQEQNHTQFNRDRHPPKEFGTQSQDGAATGDSNSTGRDTEIPNSDGDSVGGNIRNLPGAFHLEIGKWFGSRWTKAVGVAAGWVGAIVNGVLSCQTSTLKALPGAGGMWHLPLVSTNATSSSKLAHYTFNMPVPSEVGMIIPKPVHRDLKDLYNALGGDGMLEHDWETLQEADELDDQILAYYGLTRRQVERAMNRLQKLRRQGESMYSGVLEDCREDPMGVVFLVGMVDGRSGDQSGRDYGRQAG
ncbi:hypothetical protein LZ32DRAFT_619776 [Colletotrichum eremochloae]|nr:hypothetical protein LZ32DRAFT_619776 [Colletotrichum eremochloae]